MRLGSWVFAVVLGLASATALGQANPPADLIVVVDTSGSMAAEVAEVQASINDLAAQIQAASVDLHVILIADPNSAALGVCVPAPLGSGNCPDDEALPVYRHVLESVQSGDALSKILLTYSQWSNSLRADAKKFFLVVSDNDSDLTAAAFDAGLLALDGGFSAYVLHGLVAGNFNVGDPFDPCLQLADAPGTVYLELINSTGGVFGDLCGQPAVIPQTLDSIAAAIVEAVGPGTPPPPSAAVAGGNSVTMEARSAHGGGQKITLEAKVVSVDAEGTYLAELSLSGDDSSMVQDSCTVSPAAAVFDRLIPGVSRLRCTLKPKNRTLMVEYEVFSQNENVSYVGAIRIRRGNDVAVEAFGFVKARE